MKKFMLLLMTVLLGACRHHSEGSGVAEAVDVPIFETSREYLAWIAELELEVSLQFEDLEGNIVEEEEILANSWEVVSVFPLQINPETANLLIISETPLAVNFSYRLMDGINDISDFSAPFGGFLPPFVFTQTFSFSKVAGDNYGNTSHLAIWTDVPLNSFAFVDSFINEDGYREISRIFFNSFLHENEVFIIENWFDTSDLRDGRSQGIVFNDEFGRQRFFTFGFEQNQLGVDEIIFTEVNASKRVELPGLGQIPVETPMETTPRDEFSGNPKGFETGDINAKFRVTTEILNVWSKRNSNSEHLHTLRRGNIVHIRWILGTDNANTIDTPWGAIDGGNNGFVNMNFLEPVTSDLHPTSPTSPSRDQLELMGDHASNITEQFNKIHSFDGSVFGVTQINSDIMIWANGLLRDFQVHQVGPADAEVEFSVLDSFTTFNSHGLGDIAVGEAVHIQSLADYFAAGSFMTISFVNEVGKREFFRVTDNFGPGANEVALIPLGRD